MTFTNNKKRTKGRVASAKNNATPTYQAKMSKYFNDLLAKSYDEVVEIKQKLDERFKNYHTFCDEALKILFNKQLSQSIKENSDINY